MEWPKIELSDPPTVPPDMPADAVQYLDFAAMDPTKGRCAEWSYTPGETDRHEHWDNGVQTYSGRSANCTICAYPMQVDEDDH